MDKDGRLFQLDPSFFRALNSVKLVDDFVPILIVFVVRVNQFGHKVRRNTLKLIFLFFGSTKPNIKPSLVSSATI